MINQKYKTAESFREAIETRAKKIRLDTGESLDMLRRKVAFDVFLSRVVASQTPFVLKGGYLCEPPT